MNTIRNFKVRVRDYTESQPIIRKRIQTLTDGPGLLFALSGDSSTNETTPRLRSSEPEPFLVDEFLD
jgi:hypothetical protein